MEEEEDFKRAWIDFHGCRVLQHGNSPEGALPCYKVLLPNNNCTDLPEEEAQKLRLIETFSISLWLVSLLSAGPQSRLFCPRGAIRRGFLLSKQITSLHLIIIVVVVSPRRGSVPCFYILLLFLTHRMVYTSTHVRMQCERLFRPEIDGKDCLVYELTQKRKDRKL